jgi:hypothetical protein
LWELGTLFLTHQTEVLEDGRHVTKNGADLESLWSCLRELLIQETGTYGHDRFFCIFWTPICKLRFVVAMKALKGYHHWHLLLLPPLSLLLLLLLLLPYSPILLAPLSTHICPEMTPTSPSPCIIGSGSSNCSNSNCGNSSVHASRAIAIWEATIVSA